MKSERFLGLNICYKDIENKKTEFIIDNKVLKKSRELYNENDSIGLPGIILVNYLNKAKDVLNILDNFEIKNNITLGEQIMKLKEELETELKFIPLKVIINKMFNMFAMDFIHLVTYEQSFKSMQWYSDEIKDKKGSCNTFYKMLHKYAYTEYYNNNNKDVFNFSPAMLIEMFVDSLKSETNFILENCEKKIIEIPEEYQVDEFEIGKLLDLFYISKYQMQKCNKIIKICNICKKYFVIKKRPTEIYCRRKYKNKVNTCQEIGFGNVSSEQKDLRKMVRIEKNRIESMLRNQDRKTNTNLNSDFGISYYKKISELEALEVSEDEILQMKLEWLKEQHENYKKEK